MDNNNELNKTVIKSIRAELKALNLNYKQLEYYSGIKFKRINRLLTEEVLLNLADLDALARVFKIDPWYLLIPDDKKINDKLTRLINARSSIK